MYMLLGILGLIAVIHGGFKITAQRRVTDTTARVLGAVMIVAAVVVLTLKLGAVIPLVILAASIAIGLAASQRIEPELAAQEASEPVTP